MLWEKKKIHSKSSWLVVQCVNFSVKQKNKCTQLNFKGLLKVLKTLKINNRKKRGRKQKKMKQFNLKGKKGITLIALVITMIVPYDKMKKCCNMQGFLSFDYKLDRQKPIFF